MFSEIRNARQIPGEARRRWFHSAEMDLIVWFDDADDQPDSQPVAFQLCYDKMHGEKALSWKAEGGFTHMAVDDGEALPGRYKATPLLVPDGGFERDALGRRFAEAAQTLPVAIRAFVTAKLSPREGASITMASDAAPANGDPDPC